MDVYNALLNIQGGEIVETCRQATWIGGLVAHLFVSPILGILPSLWKKQSNDSGAGQLKRVAETTLWITVGLVLLLWLGDALLGILWFGQGTGSLAESLWPIHAPQKFFSRVFVSIIVLFAGGVVSRLLKNLAGSYRGPEQNDRAIQESEDKYRQLIETTGTGYVIVDEQGRVIDANQEYVRLTGRLQLEDVIGHSVLEWTAPYDFERNAEEIRKCVRQGFVRNVEIEYINPSGKITPIEINATVLHEPGNLRILTLCRDVTKRKRLEHETEERRLFLENVLAAAPDAIVTSNTQHIISEWNLGAERLFGYFAEEAIGRKIDDLITGTDSQILDEATSWTRQIQNQRGIAPTETIRYRKGGLPVNVIVSVAPILIRDEWVGGVAVYTDITERKRAEDALRESNEKLRATIEQSLDGILITDQNFDIVEWNTAQSNIFGYTREEMLTKPLWEFQYATLPQELKTPGTCEAMKKGLLDFGASSDYSTFQTLQEFKVVCKDGKLKTVQISTFPIELRNGVLFAAISRDITERKQAEDLLRQQNKYLTVLQETMLELISQLDSETLLENIVRRAGELMGTPSGFLDLVEPATGQLLPRIGIGALVDSIRYPVQPGEGVAGVVWQTGKLFIVQDYDHWTDRAVSYPLGKLHSVMGVPLLSGGKVMGALGLAYGPDTTKTFGDEDVSVLEQFARMAAIVLVNANLLATAQQELAERKQAEEALIRQTAMFRNLFERSLDAITIVDPEDRILNVNRSFEKLFGYLEAEAQGHYVNDLIVSEPYLEEAQDITQVSLVDGQVVERETVRYTKDRRPVDVSLVGYATIVDGCIIGGCGIYRDITSRKRGEEELKASEEKFRTMIEQASEGFALVDENGIVIEWNHAKERIWECPREEALGKPFYEIQFSRVVPERRTPERYEHLKTILMDALRTGQSPVFGRIIEAELYLPNGRHVFIQQNIFPVKTARGYRIGSMSLDITERKRTAMQLERNLREARVRFEISQALVGKETEDEVLDVLSQHAGLDSQVSASIVSFDRTESELTGIVRRRNSFESGLMIVPPMGVRFPASRFPLLSLLLSADHSFVSNDILADERIDPGFRERCRETGTGSFIAVPLTADGEWMGVIFALAKLASYFDEEKQHLYQTLAEQGAVVLRAAHLRETIRQSQQRLSLFVQRSPLAVIEWDTDFKAVSWNPSAERIFGYTREEALGRHANFIVPEQARPLVDHIWQALLVQKGGTYSANENLTKNMRSITCEWFNAPLVSADGRIIGVASLVQDITERKRAEEELKRQTTLFRKLFESSPEAIALLDHKDRVLEVNRSFETLFGYLETEARGRTINELIAREPYLEDAKNLSWAVLENRQAVEKEAVRFTKEGHPIDVSLVGYPIILDRNRIWAYAIYRDITERKRAERLLQTLNVVALAMQKAVTSKEVFKFVSDELKKIGFSCVIFAADKERRNLTIKHLGFPNRVIRIAEKVVGRRAGDTFFPVAAIDVFRKAVWEKQSVFIRKTEDIIRQQLPKPFNLLASLLVETLQIPQTAIAPLIVEDEVIGLLTMQADDLLESDMPTVTAFAHQVAAAWRQTQLFEQARQEVVARKQAEEEVRRLNAGLEQRVRDRTLQLETANKELEAFSYSVSHDLRAPLRGIDGWSRALLEDYGDKLDEQGQQYLERVCSETQRMGYLIEDLLQLSRLTRSEMVKESVNLSALTQSIVERLRAAEPQRKVDIKIQAGLVARGDPHLLEVMLTNLLGNAFKFTDKRPDAHIEFGDVELQGQRVFFVRDNGVGFDMAYAQKLFGAFQRMHKVSDFPGTGIGLATVQRIVHRHGGRVWADAQVDQGATFFFTLSESETVQDKIQL